MFLPSPRHRPLNRRYRFGLKTLFVLVTVLALLCSLWVKPLVRAQAERQAAAQIKGLGGRVYFRWRFDQRMMREFTMNHPRLYQFFPADSTVHAVKLSLCDVTDEQLVHLRSFTNLEMLFLDHTQVTDAALENLRGLTKLQQLWLNETHVSDPGLAHLKHLTNLQWLNLSSTRITDAGLSHLTRLVNLQVLILSDTRVTDGGVKHLTALGNLRQVALDGTSITATGARELQTATPQVRILAGG